ncbi:MAG: hypothetical protein NTU80_10515 [Verrucomicrobia bacterium]|nr:hypothetical protein [Verrucomicrobiota bacterium]
MSPANATLARRLLSALGNGLLFGLWLLLLTALALQLRIVADGGLRLPDFVVERLTASLRARGLALQAEAIWLDPQGRVLVRAPTVSLAVASGETPAPFASAAAIYLQLDRAALRSGKVEINRAEITGLALTLPALHSPTGAPQSLLNAGEFRLTHATGAALWQLDQASARVLDVPTAFFGALPSRPAANSTAPATDLTPLISRTLIQAGALYRQLATLPLASVKILRLDLAPDRFIASAEIASLLVPAHPALPPALAGATLTTARLSASLPFDDPAGEELRIDAAHFSAPPPLALEVDQLAARLRHPSGGPLLADLALGRVHKTDTAVPAAPLVATLRYEPASGNLAGSLSTRLVDAPWSITFDGQTSTRAGDLSAEGELTPALLPVVASYLPEKTRRILELTDPVQLSLAADFGPNLELRSARALVSGGRAVAGQVVFRGATAELLYEPLAHRFTAAPVLLHLPESSASGSYEMDTQTLAFRFLLGGGLRPMAIEGWFSEWWDRLWEDFHFGPVPPAAEVDIQGTWGEPDETTVFVGAASGPMALRELALDTVATRVMVQHNHIDILGFRITQGPRAAAGNLSRRLAPGGAAWERLDFDLRSDLPLTALTDLFRNDGQEIVAPFALTVPPRLRLVGQAFGPDAGTLAGAQRYSLDLEVPGALRYHNFPLDNLAVRILRQDSAIRLESIRAGFASGVVSGTATLDGPADARLLAFDAVATDASLDLTLAKWREFQAARTPPPALPDSPTPATPTKPESREKPLGGTLQLRLAAKGPADDPLGFTGQGSAIVTGADLARIRLFGLFSQLLSELGIGLTTLKLTDADARFTLDRQRLAFSELNLKGASTLVETHGDYSLADGKLAFTAKVRPFERSGNLLGSTVNLVLSPLSTVLEVELGGTLDQPDWTFALGPTRLLRRITGFGPKAAEPPSPVPAPAPAPLSPRLEAPTP